MSGELFYLYAITDVEAADPPQGLVGLEDGAVELLRTGHLAGVVSVVPAEVYEEDALNSRLDDLAWVGERGLAHERVVDWFAESAPTIPLSLFSLHRDLAAVEERLAADEEAYIKLLRHLQGRREWGIKLWRTAEAEEGIDELSPSLQTLNKQIEAAPEGKAFLLERKRDQMRTEELRTASKRVAHEIFAGLRSAAVDAERVVATTIAGEERTLLLHAAFLVGDEDFQQFQNAVNREAARLIGSGFEMEFTGPWPAYHFSSVADD